jgi:uncharacterized protein (TIGR02147 family)
MVNIFDYLDYREYIRDHYREQKGKKSFFSYRFIGNRVGMDSSYVIKVLQGNLHISRKKIPQFVTLLDLSGGEAEYFETLVLFCKAKTEMERKLCFEKLFSISMVKANRLEAHQYEFFQKWYYSAIWAIINCSGFNGNYRALARQCSPAITAWDAKRAVLLLERLRFIAKDPDGKYHTTSSNLTTGSKWQSLAIEQYQHEMMRLADASIEHYKKPERDLSTVTLNVAESALPEIRDHINRFRSSLISMINNYRGSDRVYQLNVQLFPLSVDLRNK